MVQDQKTLVSYDMSQSNGIDCQVHRKIDYYLRSNRNDTFKE